MSAARTGRISHLVSSHLVSSHLRTQTPLLPFLYYTPTILRTRQCIQKRCNPIRHKSSASSHSSDNQDAVPFEGGNIQRPLDSWISLLPADEANESRKRPRNTRTSTITKSERAAFEKLFEKALAESSAQRPSLSRESGSSKQAKPAQKDDDVLDLILQRALKHHSATSARRDGSRGSSKWLSSLQDLAQNVQSRQAKEAAGNGPSSPDQETQFLSKADVIRQREYNRVEKLISEAKTDAELWDVLEKEVFSVIRASELGEEEPADRRADLSPHEQPATFKDLMAAAPIEPSDHLHILGPNYPSILVLAIRQLRREFPSSSLPLAVLPAMKALGRDAFVLGASTVLYNELIVFIWLKYADLHGICDLLQEMDNGVVDFDENTLDVLDSIMAQMEQASKGRRGPAFKVMWNMDVFRRGAQKLMEWKRVVRSRMEADALRRANERQMD